MIAAALAAAGAQRAIPGIGREFALYGALHAVALVFSVRGAARRCALRGLLFVAGAALLAMSTARLGLYGWHVLSALGAAVRGEPAAPGCVLAASAALGALAYGALLRALLMNRSGRGGRFGSRPLGATALGCAAATAASFALCRRFGVGSALWLAIPWWFAFSGGLWWADAGRYAHPKSKSIR